MAHDNRPGRIGNEIDVASESVPAADIRKLRAWTVWDAGWNVLAEYADTGDFWDIGTMQTSYSHHGMSVLGETPGSDPSSGTYRCYLHDHLGSTRALYDDDKVILASVEHLPYGAFLSNAGAAETPGGMPTFTGKPYDSEIGLYYFPFRYYSPTAARWLTRDPLGMVNGANLFTYAHMNPLGHHDALGLYACSWCRKLYRITVAAAWGAYKLEKVACWTAALPAVPECLLLAWASYNLAKTIAREARDFCLKYCTEKPCPDPPTCRRPMVRFETCTMYRFWCWLEGTTPWPCPDNMRP